MFYIPGRGGYFFSTEPVDQKPFVQIGVVDENTSTLRWITMCTTARPTRLFWRAPSARNCGYTTTLTTNAGNWTTSDGGSSRDEFFTAAADSAQWWLK